MGEEIIEIQLKSEKKANGTPSDFDVRKLISLIREHPALYQTNHDSYRNSMGRINEWDEIASQMGCPEKVCKTKWRACRDQYAREIKRFGKHINRSRWKYARDLDFLRPYTLKRVYKNRQNCSGDQSKDSNISMDIEIEEDFPDSPEPLTEEMKFEKALIRLVQEHEYIYNTHHPNFRNFENKKLVWEEIAASIDKPEKKCRLKWKALRDQFSREAKRVNACEDPENTPKWKHYEDLKFLEKYVKIGDATPKKSSKVDSKFVYIRKTIKRRNNALKNTKLIDEHYEDSNTYGEVSEEDEEIVSMNYDQDNEQAYTFEILKEEDDKKSEEVLVDEEILEDDIHYEMQQENIITKDHSYQSNEFIEVITFEEDPDIYEGELQENYTYEETEEKFIPNIMPAVEEVPSEPLEDEAQPDEDEYQTNDSVDSQFNNNVTADDIEVDSFFKMLAKKVKNAKLSESKFTDLQIELLQTIQNKLKS